MVPKRRIFDNRRLEIHGCKDKAIGLVNACHDFVQCTRILDLHRYKADETKIFNHFNELLIQVMKALGKARVGHGIVSWLECNGLRVVVVVQVFETIEEVAQVEDIRVKV